MSAFGQPAFPGVPKFLPGMPDQFESVSHLFLTKVSIEDFCSKSSETEIALHVLKFQFFFGFCFELCH